MSTEAVNVLHGFLMAYNWDFADYIKDKFNLTTRTADDIVVNILTDLDKAQA